MVTWPARINARARSRDGARPRSTSTTSRRGLLARTVESTQRTQRKSPLDLILRVLCVLCVDARHRLALPRYDPVGDAAEQAVGDAGAFQRGVRALQALGRERAGAIEAEQRRIRRFGGRRVLAGGLAQRRRVPLDVEDVVDDL